jgi:FlaG/FlaF family flagellin (archaellin)
MGINSQGVAYDFGQLGSGFVDTTGEFTPPTGKVIVAITFLGATTLAGLVADTSQGNDAAFFSHSTAVAGNGSGADSTDSSQSFPEGLTIYGRWTSVTLDGTDYSADGIICYFGI